MKRVALIFVLLVVAFYTVQAQNPEPAGWYAGDMHVHRSCGGSPEAESSIFQKMGTQNLSTLSLLADMGNGEVQNPTTDLPLVNGNDDPLSTSSRIMHWDAEWHWDATYTEYPHQALGGHIVSLGLKEAHQIWDESTDPIFQWAHAQNAVTGFAHMEYLDSLDGNGLPSTLNCCIPVEYPVEVALGSADFISEDVDGSDSTLTAYYKLLNSGFRPGLAAGTDYPCNSGAIGNPMTFVRVSNGVMSYRNWIDGIAAGRVVISRNGHSEFLDLKVNGSAAPGDEIDLSSSGSVSVNVVWTAATSLSGTIEIVQNGVVVASKQASVSSAGSATLTANLNFAKSGWLVARRMDPNNGHMLHTGAIYVIVNNAPIRTNSADPLSYVQWTNYLLTQTSSGGAWNSFFPTELVPTQQRYQQAKALFQQIANEAQGTAASTLSSINLSPASTSAAPGGTQQFIATGKYSDGSSLNITGQVVWASSNPNVATVTSRGLAVALNFGVTTISATQGGVVGTASLNVQAAPLAITTQSLSSGTVGVAYTATLAATGGTKPYTWSITGGSLPTGLTLNASTGVVSGTPSAAGTFNITAQVSDSGSPVQGVTAALAITIAAPGACPCSIWAPTAVPGLADAGADSAVELGVEFRSDVNGYITGVRFYKSAANTGTHVGNLWTSGGTQLATATFSGETASGWQQVNFSNPVPITAGVVYVASYHLNSGHYAYDQNYFAGRGVDNPPLHALQDTSTTPDGVFSYGSGGFPSDTWTSTNYWVDVVFMPAGPDTTPPTVSSVSPSAGASGVDPQSSVSATFSEALDPSTVNGTSMQLLDASSSPVPVTVTYNPGSTTVTLTPLSALLNSSTYTVIIKGGIIKDIAGNALAADYSWSFTTAAAPAPPPTEGPGGPILIVSSSTNPFSRYYTEILRNEGFNEFTAMDISLVSADTLNNYDVVILGNFALTSSQATMFSSWVSNGGNLIAMRPDKQLTSLLGLSDTGTVLSDAYLLMNTASGPANGLVNQTIQYHGNADRYVANGASVLATLYSSATASTANPAVTLNQAGLGQAAAFTYDLARSVVYTRQGNPAWSGEARDGQSGPMRSDDLYYGDASFDPEPDYVDLNKVAIPQADEQQRLLANLIIGMNLAKLPLPRFWYFPRDFKAVVVMTGDDHGAMYGGGATATRFAHYSSLSPTGCSVADWQCVRASSYVLAPSVASNPLTNAQAATYISQGFEVGVHVDSDPDCSDWTPSDLATFYSTQITSFMSKYTSVPKPKTHRMHCIGWSDYDSQPQTELQNGIRLDTNYYYWPPEWINDTPGMFTGSGMPMRFTKRDGTMLDIYQATTQMTDESGQSYPFNIDTLLDNAVGANGYYGYFTANMHNDSDTSDDADNIIESAQSRGVPIISSAQLLTWLDGRNGSSFTSLAWNGSTLTFGIAVGAGGNGLQTMLPASSGSGTLSSVSLNSGPISFTTKTVKGISYAVFPASPGTYQAIYTAGTAVTVASVALNPSTVIGGTSSSGTVYLNGPAPAGGAQVTLATSDTVDTTLNFSTVTVPQGSTSATFTVNTNTVTATINVAITATYGGTASANLTITPLPTVASLTLNPATVGGGTSSTATVTLTQAAPAGGIVVNLSSSNLSIASVPATASVAAGSTTGTFTVTTSPVAATTVATITATYAGSSASASLTVNAIQVQSLSVSPTPVVGGAANSTATITFNGTAPAGTVVTLSSSNSSAASVPSTVTLAANSTTATFVVTSFPVSTATPVTISATYNGTASAVLTVNPPTPRSVVLSPTSVMGGNTSTGTLTLSGPAPAGGATVSLSSSNTNAATVPTSVTVSAGTTTATFTISTSAVSAPALVTISAAYGGGTATAQLTVTPTPALSTLTLSPTSVVGGNNSTGTVRLALAAPTGGFIVNLSSANPSVAGVPASVTVAAGSTSATFTITTTPVTAQTAVVITASAGAVNLTTTLTVNPPVLSTVSRSPATVTGGANSTGTVTLSGRAPTGGIGVTLASANPAVASVPATVTVAAGSTSATFTITTTPVTAQTAVVITASAGTVNLTTTLTVNPPAMSTLSRSPATVTGGANSTGTVTLNGRAPTGGIAVTLASANPAVASVPASVTVSAGSTSATFTITTAPVTAQTAVVITASAGTVNLTTTLTVNPPALSTLSLSPATVIGGTASTGTVTLNGVAPTNGIVVTLTSSNTAAATVPGSVTVLAGATTAKFTITTNAVTASTTSTISASYGTVTRTARLTVSAPALSTLSLSPSSVKGGTSSTGTVTLTGPAPSAGVVVALSSNSSYATVPSSVTVPGGASSATFTINTPTVTTTRTPRISAVYSGVTRNATLTVTP